MRYPLNTSPLSGWPTQSSGGGAYIAVTSHAQANGVSASGSAALTLVGDGDLIQAPPGGMASVHMTARGFGRKAERGAGAVTIGLGADADGLLAARGVGRCDVLLKVSGTSRRVRLVFGFAHVRKGTPIVLHTHGEARVLHIKRNHGSVLLMLRCRVDVMASLPSIPTEAHGSRVMVLPAEVRGMVVPSEREQRGEHASFSYVR